MANPKDKIITALFEESSEKFGIDVKDIDIIFSSQFKFIREKIESLDLRKLSMEEFNATKKNFNVPHLFKLYASAAQKERIENINFNKFKHESSKTK